MLFFFLLMAFYSLFEDDIGFMLRNMHFVLSIGPPAPSVIRIDKKRLFSWYYDAVRRLKGNLGKDHGALNRRRCSLKGGWGSSADYCFFYTLLEAAIHGSTTRHVPRTKKWMGNCIEPIEIAKNGYSNYSETRTRPFCSSSPSCWRM